MTAPTSYTPFHPRWYRRRVSVWWWLQKPSYAWFVCRELTSLAVAWCAGVLVWQLAALARGPETYARAAAVLAAPSMLAVNALACAALLFHAITWFNLAPKAMVVRVGGRRVPDRVVAGANYAAWAALSGLVAWLVLGS